ncbi:MAG: T9SS type A sorting domain-containing protein [Lutibacter sp.]|uniref:T9SS type A sorting domain-containing protein n=1 Tax=Lutibacter sp. TaxID=1925666 RepID=UPI0017A86F8D|nr:T9SS type A sorting domain-containing protein [Lutibacter sp.]MBT8316191.1 T9SS type A sorting domain-containing protein [Lutibacter sp.]NNJ57051.1 T9SS type A sorting domain-containing protein [Lutibacter sp.]
MVLLKKQIITVLLIVFVSNLYSQDLLKSVTNTGAGVTANNSQNWSDLVTTNIDVTGISNILVTASINMRPDGVSTSGREGNYRIYSTSLPDDSGIIKRQIKSLNELGVESWGIGTLVHIFDVSSLSGTIPLILEHSNQGASENGRNVYSSARLTVVALTTALNSYELSSDVKRINEGLEEVSATTTTFTEVNGTATSAITLPFKGSIYVMGSINGRSNAAGTTGEYQLEYSTNGSSWSLLGLPVKRTMINTWDDGIISLTGLLEDQNPGSNYQFRLVHRRISGTAPLITRNVNIVAIGLSHAGGAHFPAFKVEDVTGSTVSGVSTPDALINSTSFTTAADFIVASVLEEPDVFVSSQFLVSASGLDQTSTSPVERMRGKNQLFLDNGTTQIFESPYFRYIPDNSSFGSGGTIGLAENLNGSISYTFGMNHGVEFISSSGPKTAALSTSDVILMGFQTFDVPVSTLSTNEEFLSEGLRFFSRNNKVVLKSDKLIDVNIKIYNISGQLIIEEKFKSRDEISVNVSYNGIIIGIVESKNRTFSKKMIIK